MKLEEEYLHQRIRALEAELQLVKRRIAMPKLSNGQVEKRIQGYRNLVRELSKSIRVSEDPDTYIMRLRAKEY